MRLLVDGRLTEAATNLLLVLLIATLLVTIGYLRVSTRRAARGYEIHAHADGVVHTHWRGEHTHNHPTMVEKYDSFLTRLMGPPPHGR